MLLGKPSIIFNYEITNKCMQGSAILKDCATSTDLDNKFAEKIASSIVLTPVKPMKVTKYN